MSKDIFSHTGRPPDEGVAAEIEAFTKDARDLAAKYKLPIVLIAFSNKYGNFSLSVVNDKLPASLLDRLRKVGQDFGKRLSDVVRGYFDGKSN